MPSKKVREITDKDVPVYRRSIAVKQKYLCAICGCSLAAVKHALDHSHTNGSLRGVLCNTCNRVEGRVLKAVLYMAPRHHLAKEDSMSWLKAMIAYIEHHKASPSNIIHPTFDLAKGKQRPVKRTKRRATSAVKSVTKRKK